MLGTQTKLLSNHCYGSCGDFVLAGHREPGTF
jgi:hypothetical protein